MKSLGVDESRPTLILTECLLVYLKNEDSNNVIQWCASFFNSAPFVGILNYEMIEPFDAFGQTMVNNLRDRGCDLLGLEGCPSIDAQIERMNSCFRVEDKEHETECLSMDKVYTDKLDPAQRQTIEKLEIFDEFEEWVLLQSHYCLCFSKNYNQESGGQQVNL